MFQWLPQDTHVILAATGEMSLHDLTHLANCVPGLYQPLIASVIWSLLLLATPTLMPPFSPLSFASVVQFHHGHSVSSTIAGLSTTLSSLQSSTYHFTDFESGLATIVVNYAGRPHLSLLLSTGMTLIADAAPLTATILLLLQNLYLLISWDIWCRGPPLLSAMCVSGKLQPMPLKVAAAVGSDHCWFFYVTCSINHICLLIDTDKEASIIRPLPANGRWLSSYAALAVNSSPVTCCRSVHSF